MLSQNDFIEAINLEIVNFKNAFEFSNVLEAVDYALKGAGKRFRPLLVYSLIEDNVELKNVINAAMAIELIHSYSLIHDDLPALDNDDYRRGRLTTHKVFSEASAILAGDALLTHAFSYVLKTKLSEHHKLLMIEFLIQAAGLNGMILGQDLDLNNTLKHDKNSSEIKKLYELKTGALFGCSLVYSSILNDRVDHLETLYELGLKLGLLFQVQDDYLEKYGDSNLLGKSNTSDLENQKNTLLNTFNQDEIERYLLKGFEELKRDIISMHTSHERFIELINTMIKRRY